jgi:hypothetical protein
MLQGMLLWLSVTTAGLSLPHKVPQTLLRGNDLFRFRNEQEPLRNCSHSLVILARSKTVTLARSKLAFSANPSCHPWPKAEDPANRVTRDFATLNRRTASPSVT